MSIDKARCWVPQEKYSLQIFLWDISFFLLGPTPNFDDTCLSPLLPPTIMLHTAQLAQILIVAEYACKRLPARSQISSNLYGAIRWLLQNILTEYSANSFPKIGRYLRPSRQTSAGLPADSVGFRLLIAAVTHHYVRALIFKCLYSLIADVLELHKSVLRLCRVCAEMSSGTFVRQYSWSGSVVFPHLSV